MSGGKKYSGLVVPMVSPFAEGRIDREAVGRIVEHLIAGGADGIFVLGTTGEGPSVPAEQKQELVERTVRCVRGRAVVYAGISDNCFEHSVRAAQKYLAAGADAVVAHVPWYYPLDEMEIRRYFTALADAIEGPLMLYNIPKTTHVSISIEGVEALSRHPRIVGLKDSADDVVRMEQMIARFCGREDFCYVLGCAKWSARALLLGADGIVPSSANLVPHLYRQLLECARCGKEANASALQEETDRISSVYQSGRSLGQSLAALKAMMALAGLCRAEMSKPLEMLDDKQKAALEIEMKKQNPLNSLLEKNQGKL